MSDPDHLSPKCAPPDEGAQEVSRAGHDTVPRGATGGGPSWITPELIRETLRVWQPYYRGIVLTTQDAVTMLMDAGSLLGVVRG